MTREDGERPILWITCSSTNVISCIACTSTRSYILLSCVVSRSYLSSYFSVVYFFAEDYSTQDMRFSYWQWCSIPKQPHWHDTLHMEVSEKPVRLQIHILWMWLWYVMICCTIISHYISMMSHDVSIYGSVWTLNADRITLFSAQGAHTLWPGNKKTAFNMMGRGTNFVHFCMPHFWILGPTKHSQA